MARQQSAELKQELLYRKCVILSGEINEFVRERQAGVPTLTVEEQLQLANDDLPRAREFDYRFGKAEHERETQFQYTKQFGQQVFEVVTGLRQLGFVPESDMEWLNYPRDIEGVMRVAARLDDLGHRIGWPQHA
jgi:hypothetical protein